MSIPDYQTLMLPLLKAVSDGNDHQISDLYEALSNEFNLTEEERNDRLPSGRETYIKNRISWARTYLKKAGLVGSPVKGVVRITASGKDLLFDRPEKIDNKFLRKYPGFVEFRPRGSDKNDEEEIQTEELTKNTPSESFEASYESLRSELASDLLDTIKQSDPFVFERIVVDLMLAMGYGGSKQDAGNATRKSGDGGVDGVIKLDRLGLDTICLQAKRYTDESVGEPKVRDFAGALQGYRAKKGVFITTSCFTRSAYEYVDKIENKIVLIDGEKLSQLMIDFNIGVSIRQTYEIKILDSDYFTDE